MGIDPTTSRNIVYCEPRALPLSQTPRWHKAKRLVVSTLDVGELQWNYSSRSHTVLHFGTQGLKIWSSLSSTVTNLCNSEKCRHEIHSTAFRCLSLTLMRHVDNAEIDNTRQSTQGMQLLPGVQHFEICLENNVISFWQCCIFRAVVC